MPKVAVAHTGDTFRTSKDGGLRNHLDTIFGTLGRPNGVQMAPRGLFYKDFLQNLYGDHLSDLHVEIASSSFTQLRVYSYTASVSCL